jgi:hypothetical protein
MEYARRSMQRLGFLKWVLSLASTSRVQNLEALTRAFYTAVTKEVSIPADRREAFHAYVQQREQRAHDTNSAQIQDLYLSDLAIPSHSGAITGDLDRSGYRHAVYVEIPTWAARLRLLREQNYTLTDRGRVLLLVGTSKSDESPPSAPSNPLLLNLPERYVSLYCLLDADGDFLSVMYRRLLSVQTFTRADAGQAALDALEELRDTRLKHPSAGRLLELRAKIDKTIAAIKNQRQGGGLGPKESIATPRTEPLVDCGILSKPHADKYEYSFTDWGKTFLSALSSAASIADFLENRLSTALASYTGQQLSSTPPSLQIVERPYSQLRSGLGYVSLRELALFSIAQLLYSPGMQLFEIGAVEDVLKRAAADGSRNVRLAIGRGGGIAQVRIDKRAFGHDNS